jgi:hypothetical protein
MRKLMPNRWLRKKPTGMALYCAYNFDRCALPVDLGELPECRTPPMSSRARGTLPRDGVRRQVVVCLAFCALP